MLLEPGVVGRALDGEVQRDFQSMIGCSAYQVTEIVSRAQFRMYRFMTSLLATDGIGAAGIVRPGFKRVVGSFAVSMANRVDRRKIEYVKAHVTNHGQALVDITKGTVTVWSVGFRAWEELVPA